ncbi:MAG TPA: hypothetical protein VHM68_04450, partial [Candidatus Deferrimicrobium sp.]|nr:hypothetical protein [Candidatus Deferrimicrobium sp.]
VKPGVSILLFLMFLAPAAGRAAEEYRVYESTAASVNGEVLFVSDVAREIRNWQTRAASKSRLILSPMEDR